ncbi:MAG TPA: ABC transporter ATP-binding protein [Amycolatopsis sp.]|nr:ABC transporter ATP-binding protein [Amycolatopsis sp.]
MDTSDRSPADVPALVVADLKKHFRRSGGGTVKAIDGVHLEIAQGEIVVLLGPSGCGKTTLLRAVAGLEQPDEGMIRVAGRDVFSTTGRRVQVPTEHRDLSMMFQSYALWPHMDVKKNVAYPLRRRGVRRSAARAQVAEALRRTGISGLEDEYPHQLSGGQQQRVALARAIVAESPLVLFDEPLSNVDAKVRVELRSELIGLQRKLGFAAMYVTHDQGEAMEMGHRIAVLDQGRVAQLGSAADVYERPATRYVANFVGAANEFEAKVVDVAGESVLVETALGKVRVPRSNSPAGAAAGDVAWVMFRPEWMSVTEDADGARWTGRLERLVYLGSHAEAFVRVGEELFQVWADPRRSLAPGATVHLDVAQERLRLVTDDIDRVAPDTTGEAGR